MPKKGSLGITCYGDGGNFMVKEYRRTCKGCGKVWHSLVSREKQIKSDESLNSCSGAAQCCNPSAQLQAKRNVEANQSELSRLHRCPECGSANYDEKIV